jgi:hypothetical protein
VTWKIRPASTSDEGSPRLAVCCYLMGGKYETKDRDRHFDYLKRPEDFRHFAPEIFDRLAAFDGGVVDPLAKLQTSIGALAVGPRTSCFDKYCGDAEGTAYAWPRGRSELSRFSSAL